MRSSFVYGIDRMYENWKAFCQQTSFFTYVSLMTLCCHP